MGSAGDLGSAVSSPSRVWGGASAEIEFGAFFLTSGGNNFDNSVVLPRPDSKLALANLRIVNFLSLNLIVLFAHSIFGVVYLMSCLS